MPIAAASGATDDSGRADAQLPGSGRAGPAILAELFPNNVGIAAHQHARNGSQKVRHLQKRPSNAAALSDPHHRGRTWRHC